MFLLVLVSPSVCWSVRLSIVTQSVSLSVDQLVRQSANRKITSFIWLHLSYLERFYNSEVLLLSINEVSFNKSNLVSIRIMVKRRQPMVYRGNAMIQLLCRSASNIQQRSSRLQQPECFHHQLSNFLFNLIKHRHERRARVIL